MEEHEDLHLARNDAERAFLSRLLPGRAELMVWAHQDRDGSPWLCVSRDFGSGRVIERTLRLDYDGRSLRGGWSPASLNWDDGVRAADASIEVAPPDGLAVDDVDAEEAATLAADWFDGHGARWVSR